MKFGKIYLAYHGLGSITQLPVGSNVNQEAFNQLQTEMESICDLIYDLSTVLSGERSKLETEYTIRSFCLSLTKLDVDYWELDRTTAMPMLPRAFTPKQAKRIQTLMELLVRLATELLVNPNLIDYVGQDHQLDWLSIGNLLEAGVGVINHIRGAYEHNAICA
jgi:hypothetical protein